MRCFRRTNERIRRAAAVLLTVIMVFSAGGNAFAKETHAFEPVERGDVPFSEMKYQRPDSTEFYQWAERITALTSDSTNAEEVLSLFEQMLDFYEELNGAYSLAELYSLQHGTTKYYQEEVEAMTAVLTKADNQLVRSAQEIVGSACGAAADEVWGKEFTDNVRQMIPGTAEQEQMLIREQELVNQYQTLSLKEYTVSIKGRSYSEEQLNQSDLDFDTWLEGYKQIQKQRNEELGGVFLKLARLRDQIAKSYDYDNYAEFAYVENFGRDFTGQDAQKLCDAVKRYVSPLYNAMYAKNDWTGGKSYTVDEILKMIGAHTADLSSEVDEAFRYMVKYGLYDLEARDEKMDLGFTTYLSQYREPFLFNRPGQTDQDLRSAIHELGHFNSYYWNDLGSSWRQMNNTDVAEIHSQAMELLFLDYYDEMFGAEAETVALDTMTNLAYSLIQGCMHDELQRTIYENPTMTLAEINEAYAELLVEYNQSSMEYLEVDQYNWVQIPHTFQMPMYYISYAVSAVPALEIWQNSLKNRSAAIDQYLNLVSYGEDIYYRELLKACGLEQPFSEQTIKSLTEAVAKVTDTVIPKTAADFQDLGNHWAKEPISLCLSIGLFSGVNDTEFQPNGTMTRGMLVTVLGKAASGNGKVDLKETIDPKNVVEFTDVKKGAWYADYVEWAAAAGIVSGTGDGSFAPNRPVTREELAVILDHFTELWGGGTTVKNSPAQFADQNRISSWAGAAVKTMQMAGVISGKPDGTFDPKGTATRAEVAQTVVNLLLAMPE